MCWIGQVFVTLFAYVTWRHLGCIFALPQMSFPLLLIWLSSLVTGLHTFHIYIFFPRNAILIFWVNFHLRACAGVMETLRSNVFSAFYEYSLLLLGICWRWLSPPLFLSTLSLLNFFLLFSLFSALILFSLFPSFLILPPPPTRHTTILHSTTHHHTPIHTHIWIISHSVFSSNNTQCQPRILSSTLALNWLSLSPTALPI